MIHARDDRRIGGLGLPYPASAKLHSTGIKFDGLPQPLNRRMIWSRNRQLRLLEFTDDPGFWALHFTSTPGAVMLAPGAVPD